MTWIGAHGSQRAGVPSPRSGLTNAYGPAAIAMPAAGAADARCAFEPMAVGTGARAATLEARRVAPRRTTGDAGRRAVVGVGAGATAVASDTGEAGGVAAAAGWGEP